MIFQASGRTDVGLKRRVNEDRYALVPELGLYLVADGMGGHRAGQVASQLAAETALRASQTLEGAAVSISEKLRQVVVCANRAVFTTGRAQPDLAGMGTTLVSLLTCEDRVALAHVGDSRAYLVRDGKIRLLTDDHSLIGDLLRRQEISEAAAREHPYRHVLTRALGVRPEVQVDLMEMSPRKGDVFALCSDGLSNLVHPFEIATAVDRCADLQESCDVLVEWANDRGGDDNITVVLVKCDKTAGE